jgi:hypothetical protein
MAWKEPMAVTSLKYSNGKGMEMEMEICKGRSWGRRSEVGLERRRKLTRKKNSRYGGRVPFSGSRLS